MELLYREDRILRDNVVIGVDFGTRHDKMVMTYFKSQRI